MKCSFRPEFNVYALGLLLIEIGTWCSLENFLEIVYSDIPEKMGESETIRKIKSKLLFSLPKPFAESVITALTYRDLDEDDILRGFDSKNYEHSEQENLEPVCLTAEDSGKSSSTPRLRPGNEDDENDNFDNVDVQQKIVSKFGSCL